MLPPSFTPEYLRNLELFKVRSRRAYLGNRQGGHTSPKRGHGIEFSEYRQYELGDNPRHIDWGVYARSERLYVKRYQEEQNLSVAIILDPSPSMFAVPSDNKWIMARDLAISLAYVALMEQDTVSVISPGLFTSPPYYGARAIHSLGKSLLDLNIEREPREDFHEEYYKQLRLGVGRIRFPGVAVVLSDFLVPFIEIEKIFNALRAKNLDITAIQILGPSDRNPLEGKDEAIAIDSETGEEVELAMEEYVRRDYRALLEQHNQKMRDYFAEAGVTYVYVQSEDSLSHVVVNNLSRVGLLG